MSSSESESDSESETHTPGYSSTEYETSGDEEEETKEGNEIQTLLSVENATYKMDAKYRVHILDVQEIFGNDKIKLNLWNYQRPQYSNHIIDLESKLKNGRLYGSFSIVHDNSNDKLYLVDGQHRQRAIENYLKKNRNFHIKVQINIFEVENDLEVATIFEDINNIKVVTQPDTPSVEYIKIANKLQKKFKYAIRDSKKTCTPYITKATLYIRLKEEDILKKHNITGNQLYEMIILENKNKKNEILDGVFNEQIREKFEKYVKWLKTNKNVEHKRYNKYTSFKKRYNKYIKCHTSQFYLGLQQDFEWIDKLTQTLDKNNILFNSA
jgi:hypothetical protein